RRKPITQAAYLQEAAQTGALVQREQSRETFEPRRIRECAEQPAPHPRGRRRTRDGMLLLECRACVLDERAVADARRPGRLAGAAGEAAVEMQPQRVRRLEPPRGELLHEVDAASCRVRVEGRAAVRRAWL